jgi:thiamine-phosphate pyrophosphorylase
MKFYLISPPFKQEGFSAENFDFITDTLDIEYFQFRPKYKILSQRIKFIKDHYERIKLICKKKKIKLIVNNDFEIAKKFKFNGIHLGRNDRTCQEAKVKFGQNFIVGVSCNNSLSSYNTALNQNADYVAFGSVFKSLTKKKEAINPENLIINKKKIKLPFTLIGGINHDNILSLSYLKPNNIAVLGSIWDYEKGPKSSAILFKKIIRDVL